MNPFHPASLTRIGLLNLILLAQTGPGIATTGPLPLPLNSPVHTFHITHPSILEQIVRCSIELGVQPEYPLRIAWRESKAQDVVHINKPGRGWDWGPMQVNDKFLPGVRQEDRHGRIHLGVGVWAWVLDKENGDLKKAMCMYATGKEVCR